MSGSEPDINIILGDAMAEIKKLPDNSLDMIFTDPPYFIDRLDTTWDANEVVDSSKNKPNSHIKHLPKGMKFDKKQVKQLYDFYHEFSEKAMKTLAFPLNDDPSVIAGESGASSLGALMGLCKTNKFKTFKKKINLNRSSTVLVINTEGDTDPQNYKRIIDGKK